MLRTWSFWKTFLISYAALVAGIWGFVEASTYFSGDYLKQLLGSNWWVFYYVLPVLIAFVVVRLTHFRAEHQAVDSVLAQLDVYSQTFLRIHADADVIAPRPTNVFTLGAPAGDLDTPSYNAALQQLLQLSVIRAVPTPTNHKVTFCWTYRGYLVLQRLGLRLQIPDNAS
jgi:hypothetical protein